MDPALQRRLVLDQVQAEAGELTLLADARIGQPDRRQQLAVTEHRKNLESILSVLQASGASPLTFWASAIWTSQPCCLRVSWTILAPVIDSITAQTGSQWTP